MKSWRKAALGAVAWLALWTAVAFLTTEIQNPDWPDSRKDKVHEVYGQIAGAGMVGLAFWAVALYRKGK